MAMHTISGHLYWQQNQYMEKPQLVFLHYDIRGLPERSRDGRVWIGERSISVDVPDDFDPRPQMINDLQREKERVRADFARRIAEIDGRIKNLQAIEYTPEPA